MIAYTDDGIAVEWHSSSVPVEELDTALRRDHNLTLRFGERLLARGRVVSVIGIFRQLPNVAVVLTLRPLRPYILVCMAGRCFFRPAERRKSRSSECANALPLGRLTDRVVCPVL
jgi:hypothetical protein